MSGGSFAGFRDWEDLPLDQFWMMLKIHNQEIEKQNADIEAAKRRK